MEVQRYRPFCDYHEDMYLKNRLRTRYISDKNIRKENVDIILPTFNRSSLLVGAINSVLEQLHKSWNLYICDDGSTDNTRDVCLQYSEEPRIKYLALPHEGVSSARNYGLQNTNSSLISFLDSDNTWDPEYLSLMVTYMDLLDLGSGYCAAKSISENRERWLGDIFSWEECTKENYIDINCFMIKRKYVIKYFDTNLKRFVDWDFILSNTKDIRTSYLASPLVNYCDAKSRDRITTTVYQEEKTQWMMYIREKHRSEAGEIKNVDAYLDKDQL